MLFQWVKKLDDLVHFDAVSGLDQENSEKTANYSWLDVRQQAQTSLIFTTDNQNNHSH